jgi:hypothetical protein
MVNDTERVRCTLALILGLQTRSFASVLGYNTESCKVYSNLRIIYLFCSSKEREQSVLFTKAIGERHALNDRGAVIGIKLKLYLVLEGIFKKKRDHTYHRYDIFKEVRLTDSHAEPHGMVGVDNMNVETI